MEKTNNAMSSMGDNYEYNPDNDEIYKVVSTGPATNPTPLTYYKDKHGRIYYWNNGKKMYAGTGKGNMSDLPLEKRMQRS